ncbi:lipoyl domain-containing protein [Flavonifractor plautii]|nr:lipoyl domain-containing protein [Flavonifractor plautii]
MAEVVIMPKLGFNMDEGQLVKWHKQVGEKVKKGEVLFEINTDKTTMPVEATEDGTLLKIILEEGAFAEVFTPIAVTGAPGRIRMPPWLPPDRGRPVEARPPPLLRPLQRRWT